MSRSSIFFFFFFNDTATTEIYTLSLHDALPIFHLIPDPKITYTVKPGREDFEKGHIPGAQFLDLQADLSDQQTKLRFMLPPPAAFAAAMRRFGIGDDSKVITYSTANPQWATRVWWV